MENLDLRAAWAVAEQIEFYRAKHQIGREAMALKIGVPMRIYKKIERAEYMMRVTLLFNVAQAIEMSLEDLFYDIEHC